MPARRGWRHQPFPGKEPMIPAPVSAEATRQLHTHLELAAMPSAVPCARGHVRAVALEWGLKALADTSELLASELVTNAVRASGWLRTPGQPVIRLWTISDRRSLVIHVWDASSKMPVRRDGSPDQDGGRGLMLVQALAAEWGCYWQASGKVVWAQITQAGHG